MIEAYIANTPFGLPVAIAVQELQLEHKLIYVNLWRGDHQRPSFLALNPAGQIPVISDSEASGGRFVLSESAAILVYLAEKAGQLLPKARSDRMHVYERLIFQITNIAGPNSQAAWLARTSDSGEREFAPAITAMRERAMSFYRVLDGFLAQAPYVGGDSYSIADILAYPMAAKFNHGELSALQSFVRWRDEVGMRAAVRTAYSEVEELHRLTSQ